MRRSALTTTSVVVTEDVTMREYVITIATVTLAAWLLQQGAPPSTGLRPAAGTAIAAR